MFTGAMVALVTPFQDGEIDFSTLDELIDFQLENGIDAIVPVGTTGESPTLSHEEHKKVIERVVKVVSGQVPVIAGAGSNSTAECLVWGGIAGAEIADKLADLPAPATLDDRQLAAAGGHVDAILARKGDQDLYALRQELRTTMDRHVGVYRSGRGLAEALATIRDIKGFADSL